MMEEKIQKAMEEMSNEEFKKIIDLGDRFIYDEDREAGKELTKMCQKYGFSRKAFVNWYCE